MKTQKQDGGLTIPELDLFLCHPQVVFRLLGEELCLPLEVVRRRLGVPLDKVTRTEFNDKAII